MRETRAAVLHEVGAPLRMETIRLRDPGPREIVVRILAVDVCITDALSSIGKLLAAPPTVLGHAASAIVEEVGSRVTHVRPGQRVVIAGTPACGSCFYCVRGQEYQCVDIVGGIVPPWVIGAREDGTPVHSDGGVGTFAERMVLRESCVVAVDSSVGDIELSLLGCGLTSGVGAVVNIARVTPGSSVAVLGAGAIGLWMVQGARLAGAAEIVVVEPRAERREIALAVGATAVHDPADGDPVEFVRGLTEGRGADYVFEAAGPPSAFAQALTMTRRGGTMVPTGWESRDTTVTLPVVDLTVTSKTIIGCQYGNTRNRWDLPRFATLLERGLLDPAPVLSKTFTLDEADQALRAALGHEVVTGVLKMPS
ncbi:zinc-binding dehydrogenase [Amycolatopsis pigmentata]|uniref:Zinc-binding dehydrogenase n=1 Tax=Amycolatopsis pigmentata TaxID=450801 RepID=A0ABW5G3W1_9PSEU